MYCFGGWRVYVSVRGTGEGRDGGWSHPLYTLSTTSSVSKDWPMMLIFFFFKALNSGTLLLFSHSKAVLVWPATSNIQPSKQKRSILWLSWSFICLGARRKWGSGQDFGASPFLRPNYNSVEASTSNLGCNQEQCPGRRKESYILVICLFQRPCVYSAIIFNIGGFWVVLNLGAFQVYGR